MTLQISAQLTKVSEEKIPQNSAHIYTPVTYR